MSDNDKNNDRRLHLQFVQNVITRMNTNSFQIKTWTVTIFAAFIALAVNSRNYVYILVSIVPTVLFWLLDSYYLQQERKFRGLYNDVIAGKVTCYTMPINGYCGGKYKFTKVLLSKTLMLFYATIIICIIVLTLIA